MKSADFRCYTSQTQATAQTKSVTAGSTIGFTVDDPTGIYHAGVRYYLLSSLADCSCDSYRLSTFTWPKHLDPQLPLMDLEMFGSR